MPLDQPPLAPVLELDGIRHAYGTHVVVDSLSFTLLRGQIACLLGPSGCGKTTVLRAIAGFEPLLAGTVRINGQVASRPGFTQPPEKRRIGMVFQDYALFPHLNVAANIAFGLGAMPKHERMQRVEEMLNVVGLSNSGHKHPHELSGGQQQRVALARALAPQPELLLLDEPFSNLDVDLRERLSQEVRAILKEQNSTAIMVTHDQHEAFAIADEIGVMHGGRIEQWDSAYNLYHRPASRFVADFVGQGVFMPGTMPNPHEIAVEMGVLKSRQPLPCWSESPRNGHGILVDVLIRPDDIVHDDASPVHAEVLHKAFRGAEILYTLRLSSGGKVLSLVPSHHNHAIGERIGIRIEVDHVVAFPRDAQ